MSSRSCPVAATFLCPRRAAKMFKIFPKHSLVLLKIKKNDKVCKGVFLKKRLSIDPRCRMGNLSSNTRRMIVGHHVLEGGGPVAAVRPPEQHQCARVSLPKESGRDVQRFLETQNRLRGNLEARENVSASPTEMNTLLNLSRVKNHLVSFNAVGKHTGCRMMFPQYLPQYQVADGWPSLPRRGDQSPP